MFVTEFILGWFFSRKIMLTIAPQCQEFTFIWASSCFVVGKTLNKIALPHVSCLDIILLQQKSTQHLHNELLKQKLDLPSREMKSTKGGTLSHKLSSSFESCHLSPAFYHFLLYFFNTGKVGNACLCFVWFYVSLYKSLLDSSIFVHSNMKYIN